MSEENLNRPVDLTKAGSIEILSENTPQFREIAAGLKAFGVGGTVIDLSKCCGGTAIAGTCLTPKPLEPIACAAGVFGGGTVMVGGGILIYYSDVIAHDWTIPAYRELWEEPTRKQGAY